MTEDAVSAPGRPFVAELSLGAICVIWGSTFILVKGALGDVSPVLFLSLRFAIAAILMAGVYLRRYLRRPRTSRSPHSWRAGVVTGSALFAGYLFQTWGLRTTSPAKSGFITGLYIILVPLAAAIVYKSVPVISEWAGIAAAVVGLALLMLEGSELRIETGDLLTLGCAVAFTAHIMLVGYYSKHVDYEWLSVSQIATCAFIGLGSFWWAEQPFVRWTPRLWLAVGVTSVLATAVAFTVQSWAQRFTTATRAALIFTLEPVFSWITSYLVAGERLTDRAVTGAILILAGILLVELKPIRGRAHPLS